MASAMAELKRMLESAFHSVILRKHNNLWGIWYTGEDWEMSDAEKAALVARDTFFDYSEESFRPVVEPDGAIRAFISMADGGVDWCGDTPVDGLRELVGWMLHLTAGIVDSFEISMQPNGSMMDIDVVLMFLTTIEEDCDDRSAGVVGRFVYDPARQVLLHRDMPPVRRRRRLQRSS